MARKLWGGRFQERTHPLVERFTSSFPVDVRLLYWDIAGSVAHARMLGRQGILPDAEARRIVGGLRNVCLECASGGLVADTSHEDVHSYVEQRLEQAIGESAGRLHTARSRNDQVALDLRLYAREAICGHAEALLRLQAVLLELARAHVKTLMPGYTHLQRAQPVVLGHHLMAYVEMLSRDLARLRGAYAQADVMPLGSGALSGVPYSLDRDYVARLLGFSSLSRNSLDAVSDRDFVVDHLAALALLSVHLSRLAEELVLWSSSEFGFVKLPDAFTTGSSLMPHKRNPDVPELVRGKAARVLGSLMSLLTLIKGLPLAYNRDLQEDKVSYFEAVDTVDACVEITTATLTALSFNVDRLQDAARASFSTATDLADYLVRKGMPFRRAHKLIGELVLSCETRGVELWQISLEELRAASPLFEEDAVAQGAEASVYARDVPGGTAPARVVAEAEAAAGRIKGERRWWAARRASLPDPMALSDPSQLADGGPAAPPAKHASRAPASAP